MRVMRLHRSHQGLSVSMPACAAGCSQQGAAEKNASHATGTVLAGQSTEWLRVHLCEGSVALDVQRQQRPLPSRNGEGVPLPAADLRQLHPDLGGRPVLQGLQAGGTARMHNRWSAHGQRDLTQLLPAWYHCSPQKWDTHAYLPAWALERQAGASRTAPSLQGRQRPYRIRLELQGDGLGALVHRRGSDGGHVRHLPRPKHKVGGV